MDTTFLKVQLRRWERLADELDRIAVECLGQAHAQWHSAAAAAFREELAGRAERIRQAGRHGRDVVAAYAELITAVDALPAIDPADVIPVDPISLV